jgi:hypothetical protein
MAASGMIKSVVHPQALFHPTLLPLQSLPCFSAASSQYTGVNHEKNWQTTAAIHQPHGDNELHGVQT